MILYFMRVFNTISLLWRQNFLRAKILFITHARTDYGREFIGPSRKACSFFTHGPPHRETPPKIPLLKQVRMRDFVSPFLVAVPMF